MKLAAAAALVELGVYKEGEPIEAVVDGEDRATGHPKLGHHKKAVSHSRRAVELEPGNSVYVSDLGYTLLEAGSL